MKSMWPPLATIFFMTYFHRAWGGGAWPLGPLDPLLKTHRFHDLGWIRGYIQKQLVLPVKYQLYCAVPFFPSTVSDKKQSLHSSNVLVAQERFNDTGKELRQFLAETAQLDMKKVDFEKIRTILRKGIRAFAQLREQWAKMVQFFKMTSNIIEVCLDESVKKLTEQMEKTSTRKQEG